MHKSELNSFIENSSNLPFHKNSLSYYRTIWKELYEWLKSSNRENFYVDDIDEFCKYKFNTTSASNIDITSPNKRYFSGLSALKNFIRVGKWRQKIAHITYTFEGRLGKTFSSFLDEYKQIQQVGTVVSTSTYLHFFYDFLSSRNIGLNSISVDCIDEVVDIFSGQHQSVRKKFKNKLRVFFRWCFYNKIIEKDLSVLVKKEKIIHEEKLPSTFSTEECKLILNAVDRASAVGKRDYAILLCIAVYGWRAGDIRNIRLEDIDWKNNKISFIQQKTKVPAEYPILPVVGNAIADYLKNARPKSNSDKIFLKMSYKFSGQIITGPAFIQAILLKYIQRVGIKDLESRKHGTHALRFTLATNLIRNGQSIHITKSILGHKSTDVTLNYVRLDIESLRKCNLHMPVCISPLYKKEEV
jgi:site-specific recombinase XerD